MSHSTATTPMLPPAGLAAGIAAALDRGELFTGLAARLAGEPVTYHPDAPAAITTLSDTERGPLRTLPGTCGIRRHGTLRTASGRNIARVSAVYLPRRIPDETALRALHATSEPLGAVLAPLGVIRQSLGAMVIDTGDIAVRARGLLLIAGVPVALAVEQVLRSFAVTLLVTDSDPARVPGRPDCARDHGTSSGHNSRRSQPHSTGVNMPPDLLVHGR